MMITKKGQVTIPGEIRKVFGFLPHSHVDFLVINNQVVLKKSKTKPSKKTSKFSHLVGKADSNLTTEEIMSLMRGE